MRPPITITNTDAKGQVTHGWAIRIGKGPWKRFNQRAWEFNGVNYINEQIAKWSHV